MSSKQGPRVVGRRASANAACHRHPLDKLTGTLSEVAA